MAPRRGKRELCSIRWTALTQSQEIPVSHGSYFYYAWQEGLLAPNNSNIVSHYPCQTILCFLNECSHGQHVGIRGAINSWQDYEDDYEFGWVISHAWDAEDLGWEGVVKKIRDTVGDNPVYSTPLSVLRVFLPRFTGLL